MAMMELVGRSLLPVFSRQESLSGSVTGKSQHSVVG